VPQARQGNLADVSAKDGSQETLVNLAAALITSLWLLPILDGATGYVVSFIFYKAKYYRIYFLHAD
jgi:hypothetical protein